MCDENTTSASNGCVLKVLNLLSTFRINHQVYPSDPVAPEDCEFIIIDSKIKIRVIHVTPVSIRKSMIIEPISKRSSLTEEYWFTRNKPSKACSCNCSFRRSQRFSIVEQPVREFQPKSQRSSIDLPPPRITNVNTFIERLVQDTFYEAFQEYYMVKNETDHGKINLAYEATEDDNVMNLTNKKLLTTNENIKRRSKYYSSNKIQRISIGSFKQHVNCIHKRNEQNNHKPLILFLHGIGTSADIWWTLIHNFTNRGFEVVAPDLLGHGYSSAPNKSQYYSFNNLLLQFISVFDYYMGTDENRKCIIIGHSYGCSIITALYPHRAAQITQLILISGGGPTPLAPPVKSSQISIADCAHSFFYPLVYCGFKRSLFYSSRGKHFQPSVVQSGVPSHVLEYIANGQKWHEGDAAFHRRILVPTLLVHGLQDKLVTLVQECEMERTIPRACLELIPNAGHLSMLDTPEHLTHMITCFIDMWSS